jgi:hypothetical protein
MAVVVVDHRIRQATRARKDRAVMVMVSAAALEDMAAEVVVVMALEVLVAQVAQTAMTTMTKMRTQSLVDVGGEGTRKRTINVQPGV